MHREIAKMAVDAITQNSEGSDVYLLGCYVLLRELSDQHFSALELLAKGPVKNNELAYAIFCDLSYLDVLASVCVNNETHYTALRARAINIANIKNSCFISEIKG